MSVTRLRWLILGAALIPGAPRHSGARVLLSQQEALALAFPAKTRVERRTTYLTDEQQRQAQEAGQVKIESKVWAYYVGVSEQGVRGYAYFETHVVRTMPETFMVALTPEGSVRFVEILAFLEPEDYLPRPRWLAQFQGRKLDGEIFVRRGIRNITGATLSSQALADGVRRVLAVHGVLHSRNTMLSASP